MESLYMLKRALMKINHCNLLKLPLIKPRQDIRVKEEEHKPQEEKVTPEGVCPGLMMRADEFTDRNTGCSTPDCS